MNQQSLGFNNQKKNYQAPQLQKYGRLAEITYNQAGSGLDSPLGGAGSQP